jgi:hypothetical protein
MLWADARWPQVADRDTYPDLDALAGGVEEELVRLEKVTVPASAARC